jgi:peptide/nickel transport system permease protein
VAAYLVRRVIAAIVTIWLVVSGVFAIFFILPGGAGKEGPGGFSPVTIFLAGRGNSRENLTRIERDLGLDQPLPEQYARYMSRLARGNLGFTYSEEPRLPVTPIIKSSFRPTLELALGGSIVALLVALTGGVLSARQRSRWTDRLLSGFSLISLSVPSFVVGVLAIFLLATFNISTQGQYQPMSAGLWGWLKGLWVPWIALAFPFIGIYFRILRTNLVGLANEDFIRTAKAKGLHELQIVRHQLRAGFMPVLTAYGVDLAQFLGGCLIVESIFDIPGLGNLAVGSIRAGDFPVLIGVTIVGATAAVLLSLLVDLAYAYLDPRIGYGRKT